MYSTNMYLHNDMVSDISQKTKKKIKLVILHTYCLFGEVIPTRASLPCIFGDCGYCIHKPILEFSDFS